MNLRSVDHQTVRGMKLAKAKTREGLTLEIEYLLGKGNINSRGQTDKSHNSPEQYSKHEEDSRGRVHLASWDAAGWEYSVIDFAIILLIFLSMGQTHRTDGL